MYNKCLLSINTPCCVMNDLITCFTHVFFVTFRFAVAYRSSCVRSALTHTMWYVCNTNGFIHMLYICVCVTVSAGGGRRPPGYLVLPESLVAEAGLPRRLRQPGALAGVRVRLVQPRQGLRGPQGDAGQAGIYRYCPDIRDTMPYILCDIISYICTWMTFATRVLLMLDILFCFFPCFPPSTYFALPCLALPLSACLALACLSFPFFALLSFACRGFFFALFITRWRWTTSFPRCSRSTPWPTPSRSRRCSRLVRIL